MAESVSDFAGEKQSLNETYTQSVKRIAHSQDETPLFRIPKQVIEKREKAWSKLFDRYSEDIEDDYEIDMMEDDEKMSVNDKEEEHEEADDEIQKEIDEQDNEEELVDNDQAESDYFVKNRTPIRKVPALVQYWVDTGNPPFQLNCENDDSESSLSEEGKSSPLILHKLSYTDGRRDNSTSFLSSVDTAAYILSNTNVTTKADTLAIVEGAKKSDSPPAADGLLINTLKRLTSAKKNNINNNTEKNNKPQKENKNVKNNVNCVNKPQQENENVKNNLNGKNKDDSVKNVDINKQVDDKIVEIKIIRNCDKPLYPLSSPNCMKITDILPTLEQLDKTFNDKKNSFDELSDIVTKPLRRKSLFRRKLYTKRDSPVDLIESNIKHEARRTSMNTFEHPAFLPTPKVGESKKSTSKRRRSRWFKRKKKRLSQLSKLDEKEKGDESQVGDITAQDTLNISKNAVTFNTSYKNNKTRWKNLRNLKRVNYRLMANLSDNSDSPGKIPEDKLETEISEKDDVKTCEAEGKNESKMIIDKMSNIERLENDTEKSENNLLDVSICKSSPSQTRSLNKIDIDSQESDQSTIIIFKCGENKNIIDTTASSQKLSDDESVKTVILSDINDNESNKSTNQEILETENVETEKIKLSDSSDDESSDLFGGKFNRKTIFVPPQRDLLLDASSESSPKKTSSDKKNNNENENIVNSQSTQNSAEKSAETNSRSKFQMTFLSDEEDDFTKMIRQNQISSVENSQSSQKSSANLNNNNNSNSNVSKMPSISTIFVQSDDDDDEDIQSFQFKKSPQKKRQRKTVKKSSNENLENLASQSTATIITRRKSQRLTNKEVAENSNNCQSNSPDNEKVNNYSTLPKKLKQSPNNLCNGKDINDREESTSRSSKKLPAMKVDESSENNKQLSKIKKNISTDETSSDDSNEIIRKKSALTSLKAKSASNKMENFEVIGSQTLKKVEDKSLELFSSTFKRCSLLDEEDDFTKMVHQNKDSNQRGNTKINKISVVSHIENNNNNFKNNSINDNGNGKIGNIFASSDDEDLYIIGRENSAKKRRRRVATRKEKTPSKSLQLNNQKVVRNLNNYLSDSSDDDKDVISPPKKLKMSPVDNKVCDNNHIKNKDLSKNEVAPERKTEIEVGNGVKSPASQEDVPPRRSRRLNPVNKINKKESNSALDTSVDDFIAALGLMEKSNVENSEIVQSNNIRKSVNTSKRNKKSVEKAMANDLKASKSSKCVTKKSAKKVVQKNSSILTSDESSLEDNDRWLFGKNKIMSHNKLKLNGDEEISDNCNNIDILFPDPVQQLFGESSIFNKSIDRSSTSLGDDKDFTSSLNCKTKNKNRFTFCTKIYSDSE